jgi:hypothetical protein
MFIGFSEMRPAGMGLATTTTLVRLTMLLKSMSALFPAHCLEREGGADVLKKRDFCFSSSYKS